MFYKNCVYYREGWLVWYENEEYAVIGYIPGYGYFRKGEPYNTEEEAIKVIETILAK